MSIITRLNEIISEYDLLQHPYYQAWSRGELSQETLKNYAVQYNKQVMSFPRFLSQSHAMTPNIEVRKVLLENLIDEELSGTDHPTLWMQFAKGLGATTAELNDTPAFPETQNLVDVYYDLAKRDWRDGLCALYAYECQVPQVSASKIAGLKEFYGIHDESTLEFFTAHQKYDVIHAEKVAELIEQHVDLTAAEIATRAAAKAQWQFLDGMCRTENIHC